LTSAGARRVILELDTDHVTTIAWGAVLRLAHEGIVFTALAAEQASFGGWPTALCELDNATRDGDPTVPRSLEAFAERFATLHIDPQWCFLARIGDRYVGYTVLDAAAADGSSIAQSWTGVRPQYRRRGIATALKEVARRAAADAGYGRIRTVVRSTNVAALALNAKLGFRPPAEHGM
jgi:mycothiol synthase